MKICAARRLTSAQLPAGSAAATSRRLTFGIMREALPPVVSFICGGQGPPPSGSIAGGTPGSAERYIQPSSAATSWDAGTTGRHRLRSARREDQGGVRRRSRRLERPQGLGVRCFGLRHHAGCRLGGGDERGFQHPDPAWSPIGRTRPSRPADADPRLPAPGTWARPSSTTIACPSATSSAMPKGGSAKVLSQTWTTSGR